MTEPVHALARRPRALGSSQVLVTEVLAGAMAEALDATAPD
jgi:hypothetical protein